MNKRSVIWGLGVLLFSLYCAAAAGAKDGLIVVNHREATTMDPIAYKDFASHQTCRLLYDTLIYLDFSNGRVEPSLAESWELLSDREYKFNLRKGVKFHNGDEMTAEDVRYSILRTMTPDTQTADYLKNVQDVQAVDDYTVILRLKNVDYSFLPSLSHCWSSIVSKKAVEKTGKDFGANPVGTGPFKLASWQMGRQYVLERFEEYWGPKAKIRTLEVRSVPEPSKRMKELQSGQADIIFPLTRSHAKQVERSWNLVLYRQPQDSLLYLGFNCAKKPFDDVRVRRAISAALDIEKIQAPLWNDEGEAPRSLIPASIRYSIDSELKPHVQDVELAEKLLAEAGIRNLKLEIWTDQRRERIGMATEIVAQLREVGIAAEVRVLERDAYLKGLKAKIHDLYLLSWTLPVPDPNFAVSALLETGASFNYAFFSDGKLDELLSKGRGVPDGEERAAIYREVQLYVNEQLPMIYLWSDNLALGAQNYVKGLLSDYDYAYSFREIYLE
ncbi:MAG: ABC transporter substrate-binding protein [Synergistaceae bacterium]|jgi:peptide/nickel transport system substrate-binding protein|nr:ABC transporter substrate-binding protein [Synergistaceae bacterium]